MKQRPFIRTHFDCRPGGCGAKAGQPCVNYTGRNGHENHIGQPVPDVHAPRWRAFRLWLNDLHGAALMDPAQAGEGSSDAAR